MKTLGILGGMGPAATVDFYGKVVSHTPASRDQDHVPVLIHADPRIADRTAHLLHQQEDPYPALRAGAQKLERMGADFIAIPCNTAHFCHEKLQEEVGIPVLHIVDAVVNDLHSQGLESGDIGILATEGTRKGQVYEAKLRQHGFIPQYPDWDTQNDVNKGIKWVKAGDFGSGKALFAQILRQYAQNNTKIVLACTEIPVALKDEPILQHCIDATDALARFCVRYARH